MIEQNNKLSQVTCLLIMYYIERLNGVLGRTHLQKLLFFTDLIATKNFTEKITALEFKKYDHGPFAQELENYIKYLTNKKYIDTREYEFANGSATKYYRYYLGENKKNVKPMLQKHIGADKMIVVEDVINSYGNMSLQDLLDIVYSLEVVKGTEYNTPMALVTNNKEKIVSNEKVTEFDI